jgi:predicted RNase H-like HicB family nuclease
MRVGQVLTIEIEHEEDGRWIGEVPELPGVLVYAPTPAEARTKVMALAMRVIADRLDHGEPAPESILRDIFVKT